MVRPIRNGKSGRNMRPFREKVENDFISEKIYISFEGSAINDRKLHGIIENLGYTKENQYYLDDDWGDFQITNYSKKIGKFNIEIIVKEGTRHDPGYYNIRIKSDSNDIDWEGLDASLSRLNFDEGRDLSKLETVLRGFTNESYRRSARRRMMKESYGVYDLIDYFDVWGNEEDGWDVNNIAKVEEGIYIDDSLSDEEIVDYLIDEVGFFSPSARGKIEVDSSTGDFIEFFNADTYEPLGRLERTRTVDESYRWSRKKG